MYSKIPVKCNTYTYEWSPQLGSHIHRTNYPKWANVAKVTLTDFIIRSNIEHKNCYDYSMINPSDLINTNSKVNIICKICHNFWNCKVANHLYNKRSCPSCRS